MFGQVHLEIDTQLDKAMTSYSLATSELASSGPNESELAEIKGYHNPPEAVKLVVMSLCIVFERPVDWKSCQSLLSELSGGSQKSLVTRLIELSPNSLPPLTIAKLARLTQEPHL